MHPVVMHSVVMHQKYNSEEHINDNEPDFLLEVNIDENAFTTSRRSDECYMSSNMDHDDLWEVTILPSLSSQAASSNDTLQKSMRVLNTATEHETKRGLHFSIDERKRENERIHKSVVTSKIAASPTYEKLNLDNSRRSFNWDKRSISALHGGEKELDNRRREKLNNTRSGVHEDTDNEWKAPFIELRAVCKVLDLITNSDPKVSSLTNNCCNEIWRTLRYLIAFRRDKKLDDLLLNDSSLYRCERCGVISHMLESYPVIEEIKRNRTRVVQNANIATTERDCINHHRNKEKLQISASHSNLNCNAQSKMFVDNCEADNQVEYEGELNETELLPAKERSFVISFRTESPNGANNISATETDANAKIKNTPHLNNSAIKRLFADYDAARQDIRCESNCVTRNNRFCHVKSSTTTKVCANIDKEIVVKKISYENKSQFAVADLRSRSTRKSKGQQRFFEKDDDTLSVGDTMKYLARGQFTALDKEENDLFSKLQDKCHTRLEDPKKKQNSVLYSSRDDHPRCNPGFWLFDKLGHLPEVVLDQYRFLPMSSLNDNNNDFHARNMGKNSKKTGSWTECMERDSLENCTLLEQREESDTMTFSSSSAENLIYEWTETLGGKNNLNDTDRDIPRGRPLVSSRPSLDIARHVKAEIAQARRSNDARESMGEIQTRDSNVLARLSPETRNKMCHSIGKIILSDTKDSMFYREKNFENEKLSCSKSNNVTFIHSDKSFKVNNEMTNTWLDDCISTKLSELRQDKSSLIKRRDNVIEVCSQSEIDKSKDHVKILHKYSTAGKLGKTREKLMNDSFGKITRRIVYKNLSPENVKIDNRHVVAEISPVYREILENSENMDWDGFRELIESLHPGQKDLWRDICKTVYEEATRLSDDVDSSMEVCIEISPVILEKDLKTDKPTACAREIVFELDMMMKDVESFLNKRPHLAEEHLDTHKAADKSITDWVDDARKLIPEQTN